MTTNEERKAEGVADAPRANWVDDFAPDWAKPYLRLSRADRPIGTWLLLLPCWWSVALAADDGGWPAPGLLILFAIGAIVMRGAGCTFNDIVDRRIDAAVERTRSRPIPSGQVTVQAAIFWMVVQSLVGLGVLLEFPAPAIWIGAASLVLVAIYPFMKRVTWWPQFYLGLAFNWGALMGEPAAGHAMPSLAALLLYLGGIAWTLGYDTIYAHQDKADDELIGVKSSARRLGDATPRWLGGFYGVAVLCAGWAGLAADLGWAYWLGLLAFGGHLAWQVSVVRIDDPADCLRWFRSNRDAGLILFVAIVLGRLTAGA